MMSIGGEGTGKEVSKEVGGRQGIERKIGQKAGKVIKGENEREADLGTTGAILKHKHNHYVYNMLTV